MNLDYPDAIFINTDTILNKEINAYSLSKTQIYEWLHYFKSSFTCIDIALEHFYGPNDNKKNSLAI